MSKSFNHCQFWESLRSRNRIYNTWQPHPQLLTSCMIGTPMFCMLVMIHFTSIGIWACCTSLAKFSSVIPTENIDELKNIMQYKFSKKGACRNSFSSTISVLTSAGQEHPLRWTSLWLPVYTKSQHLGWTSFFLVIFHKTKTPTSFSFYFT